MSKTKMIIPIILLFAAEIVVCLLLFGNISDMRQDTVKINEVVQSVEDNFGDPSKYSNALEYTVIGEDGTVFFRTSDRTSATLNEAIKNNDTVIGIKTEKSGEHVTVLILNDLKERLFKKRNIAMLTIAAVSVLQFAVLAVFFMSVRKNLIKPFEKMKAFAERIACGDLDIPIEMDKGHAFGNFTEAFDIMRNEIRQSREAEKKANDEKKEMIAKLSHDIKTPVASIKSASEIGYEIAANDRSREIFNQINIKADQLTNLSDNLFHSSINDITEIEVNPSEYDSAVVCELIKRADYLNKASVPELPKVSVYIDKLRLQQTFDNIFANSYKYAGTEITVDCRQDGDLLRIFVSDKGPGVPAQELPLLKERYRRGSNSAGKEGAGLGLYLADFFLDRMNGRLELCSDASGFTAEIDLRII